MTSTEKISASPKKLTSNTRRRTLSSKEKEALYTALLLMKGAGATVTSVALDLQVSRQTADNYRRFIISNGHSLDSPRTPEEAAAITETMMNLTATVKSPEMSVKKMEVAIKKRTQVKEDRRANRTKGHLKAEARLNLLSEIAETEGISPQARVTAVTKIDDIEFRSRSPESFGPPAPLSREDRIIRGMRVMECLGRDLSLEVLGRMKACDWKPPFPQLETPHGTSTDSIRPGPEKEEEGAADPSPSSHSSPPPLLPSLSGGGHKAGDGSGGEVRRTTLPSNRPWREADVPKEDAPEGTSSHNSTREEAGPREDS